MIYNAISVVTDRIFSSENLLHTCKLTTISGGFRWFLDKFWWVLAGSNGFWWILVDSDGLWWILIDSGGFWWILLYSDVFWMYRSARVRKPSDTIKIQHVRCEYKRILAHEGGMASRYKLRA